MPTKEQVLNGRVAIKAYRDAHALLYSGGWHKDIPEAHTPLLDKMLTAFKQQGFSSQDEFFAASRELSKQTQDGWK